MLGGGRPAPPLEELQQRLTQDEEWLKEFQETLSRNAVLTNSVSTILDDFHGRITDLSNNVSTLYSKTSVIQREQQNVKKLLSIVDATIQFHGKTMDFENTIRDGNLLHNLNEYLEKMNTLKEAIAFFSSHATYQGQLIQMRQIFETGCGYLEAEFGNLIKLKSTPLDAAKIFECLDEEYEIPNFRIAALINIKDTQKLSHMASWLIGNTKCTQYLNYYATYRSENMMKTQKIISDQTASNSSTRGSKTHFIKSALKKAASKIGDKSLDLTDVNHKDYTISIVLFMLSATCALIQMETKVCASIFSNVRVEADVLRKTISAPLMNAISFMMKSIDTFDGSFESIYPLVKYFAKHANEISSLCENIGEASTFSKLKTAVRQKSVNIITDFIDRLTNDHKRFVPEDGNVHHVTSSTLNFLKLLVQNRPVIGYIYESNENGAQNSSRNMVSKIFAQTLKALGNNLRNKSASYSDSTLGALFMFNNLNYITISCTKDKNLMSVLDSSKGQLWSFYQSEINEYLNRYLQSWSKVTAIFSAYNDDRKSARFVYSNFNKEFDSIIDAQRNYCLVDMSLAHDIRKKIKELVLKPNSRECQEVELDRQQLKFDAESIELIIDRLFDVTY